MGTADKTRNLFNKKATFGLAGCMLLSSTLSGCSIFFNGEAQPLTQGEAAFTHAVFGGSVNTGIVRKYLNRDENKCSNAVVYGDRFMVFYEQSHAHDYSNPSSPEDMGLFAHEMTHIWQGQNWSLFKQTQKKCSTYNYTLTPDSAFDDFCNEQQAAMVQDYVRYFLTTRPVFPTRLENNDNPNAIQYLADIIEQQFPTIIAERNRTEQNAPHIIAERENIESYRREKGIKTITRSICS